MYSTPKSRLSEVPNRRHKGKRMLNISFTLWVALAMFFMAQGHALASKTTDLQHRVREELERYYYSPFTFKIGVETPGNIIVEGKVPTYWDKLNIYKMVSRVPGVKNISEHLVVDTVAIPDKIIEANIQFALSNNHSILEPDKIDVAVNDGLVILNGTVNFHREATATEDIAGWTQGVKGVTNNLKVPPVQKEFSDKNLSAVLQDVVGRFFPLEKETVQVKVKNGQAILNGTVKSLWARHAIEKEALQILGIYKAQNHLTVKQVN